jgi:4-amino-4-deoxy-L-arabinose transferase-like glycosyltransferase
MRLQKFTDTLLLIAGKANGWPAMILLLITHFFFLALFFAPAISTPDANGYLAQARLIAENGRSDIVVENPSQYVGDHWMKVADGHYYGQYPPGLPAVLAIVYKLISPEASLWVIPLMGTASLLAIYLIVRLWAGPLWGLLAAALMFFNPYANAHAMGADSHTAVCFFLLWGLYGLARWETSKSPGWAALAGLCLGMIPTIRYAEALFIVAAAVFVLLNWRPADGLKTLIAGILAACVPMGALAVRNQIAFGAFWKTGYSVSGEQTGFALSYFVRYAIPYLLMLFGIGAFAVFIMGIRGLVKLTRNPETWKRGLLLILMVLPITLLYFAYYFHANPKNMRFFLPTFYLYAIAACYSLSLEKQSEPERTARFTRNLFLLNLLWGLPFSIVELSHLKGDNSDLAHITTELQKQAPPGSVIISDSGILQHFDFVGGWKLAPVEGFERRPRRDQPMGPGNFGPGGPGRFGPDGPENLGEQPAERLSPEQYSAQFRQGIADWSAGKRQIFILTSANQIKSIEQRFQDEDTFEQKAIIRIEGRRGGPPGPPPDFDESRENQTRDEMKKPAGPQRKGMFGRLFGPPGPPPDFTKKGRGPMRKGGPGGRGGPPGFYHPPEDGQLVLFVWQIGKPAKLPNP